MKRFFWQAFLIIAVSALAGILVNTLSRDSLPVFRSYVTEDAADKSAIRPEDDPYISEIDIEMLLSLIESNQVILLDARSPDDFSDAHIRSAINLPLPEFETRYEQLAGLMKQSPFIVTYAGSSTPEKSYLLAGQLRKKGLMDVFVLQGGFQAWQDHLEAMNEFDQP